MLTFVNFYTERWKQMPISLKQALCTQFKVGRPRLVSGTWSSTMFFHIIAVFGNWNGESAIKVIANFAVNSSYELWKTPVAYMASSSKSVSSTSNYLPRQSFCKQQLSLLLHAAPQASRGGHDQEMRRGYWFKIDFYSAKAEVCSFSSRRCCIFSVSRDRKVIEALLSAWRRRSKAQFSFFSSYSYAIS